MVDSTYPAVGMLLMPCLIVVSINKYVHHLVTFVREWYLCTCIFLYLSHKWTDLPCSVDFEKINVFIYTHHTPLLCFKLVAGAYHKPRSYNLHEAPQLCLAMSRATLLPLQSLEVHPLWKEYHGCMHVHRVLVSGPSQALLMTHCIWLVNANR